MTLADILKLKDKSVNHITFCENFATLFMLK
jgi:hypothetical protein